ncbi:MAG: acyltransferase [Marmoricola sp.]|nr:acyltransferase [Marmoricola sp.]
MAEAGPAHRLSGLDGMRGIFALSVLVGHVCGLIAPDSTAPLHIGLLAQAVVAFFALSGFLIFLPFCQRLMAGKDLPALGGYALRRVTRVYPGYLAIFLLADFALGAVFTRNAVSAGPDVGAATGRITDPVAVLVHLTLGQALDPGRVQTGLNTAWSLTTELGFYLLVPLLAALTVPLVRGSARPARRMLVPIGAMALTGLAAKAWIAHVDAGTPKNLEDLTFGPHPFSVFAESTLAFADVFATGMAAALVFVVIQRGGLPTWTGARLLRWALPLGGIAAVVALVCLAAQSAFASAFLGLGAGIAIVLVTEPVARGQRSRLGDLLDVAPLKYVGTISLSVYLWHYPVLVLVDRRGWFSDSLPGAFAAIVLVTAITVALSAVTYHWIERPAMNFHRTRRRTRVPVAGQEQP